MMKKLALLLFLFPSLGVCAMQDDLYYGNNVHRQAPFHRMTHVDTHHSAIHAHRRAGHAKPRHRGKVVPNARHHGAAHPPAHVYPNGNTIIVPGHR